jgi:hypothetical protein
MAEDFPHLALQRETPVTDKRPGQPPRFNAPADVREHSLGLLERLSNARKQCEGSEGGFDDRKLIKFTVEKGFRPDDLRQISQTIEFVSQEEETVIIGFDEPFCVIGERINPTGRKKLAAELEQGDFTTVDADAIAHIRLNQPL